MRRFVLSLLLIAPATMAVDSRLYEISVSPVSAAINHKATASIVFRPAPGFHINKMYPTSLKCHPPEGVALAKADLSAADGTIDEKEGRFELIASASSAGKHIIPCDLRFAVASASEADPESACVEVVLEVK